MALEAGQFNALNPTSDINSVVNIVNAAGANKVAPELFYTKQLLETIRLGADQYPYFRLADTSPIPDKSGKLQLRRWSPLQAHTVPLVEGIPPKSDKGSVETYEIGTYQYGRFMEFSDKVDFQLIDPIIATYSKEYSVVAVETLDMLARDTLLSLAQVFYANQKKNFEALTVEDKPSIADMRLAVLSMKKALVRPRMNGKFHVICSPEFTYDMITDPYVEKFMQYSNTTKPMYENGSLVPMFDMEFYESMAAYNSGEFTASDGKRALRVFRYNAKTSKFDYATLDETTYMTKASGYVKDSRTSQDASYLPDQAVWDIAKFNNAAPTAGTAWASDAKNNTEGDFREFLVHHCLIVGKDALIRTGLSGMDNAKMYVKGKGSSGVLDPIDQRQSIGFKIDSVGFGSARNEAIVDYRCVPSTLNMA